VCGVLHLCTKCCDTNVSVDKKHDCTASATKGRVTAPSAHGRQVESKRRPMSAQQYVIGHTGFTVFSLADCMLAAPPGQTGNARRECALCSLGVQHTPIASACAPVVLASLESSS
jgi:hypothetical protein